MTFRWRLKMFVNKSEKSSIEIDTWTIFAQSICWLLRCALVSLQLSFLFKQIIYNRNASSFKGSNGVGRNSWDLEATFARNGPILARKTSVTTKTQGFLEQILQTKIDFGIENFNPINNQTNSFILIPLEEIRKAV